MSVRKRSDGGDTAPARPGGRDTFSRVAVSCRARGDCAIISGMGKPATDIYTFSELVKFGCMYIDKTDQL